MDTKYIVILIAAGLLAFLSSSAVGVWWWQNRKTGKNFRHTAGGTCLAPQGGKAKEDTLVVFSDDCKDTHKITENGAIKHEKTGLCIHPKGGKLKPDNDTRLVYHKNCDADYVQFSFSNPGPLKHSGSGLCVAPYKGTAGGGTEAVLHDAGCSHSYKLV